MIGWGFWTRVPEANAMASRSNVRWLGILALLLTFLLPSGWASDERVPEQIVVQLQPGRTIAEFLQQHTCCVVIDSIERYQWYLLRTPAGATEAQVDAWVAEMLADPNLVHEAEPHRFLEDPEGVQLSIPILDITADPNQFRTQTAAQIIHTTTAQVVQRGFGVTVAVLDTGVHLDNSELKTVLRADLGANFAGGTRGVNPNPNGLDDDGDGTADEATEHGTLVAGMVNLAAPRAQIIPIRVLDDEGRGRSFDVAKGIYWAIDKRADVINLSLAMRAKPNVVGEAMREAVNQNDIAVVCAAGNRGIDLVDYPAGFSTSITVAAVDDGLVKTGWSSYGGEVDLSAPASGPLSTYRKTQFATWDGTSFAAPQVTGAVALLLERYPGLSANEVRDQLRATTQPDHNPGSLAGKMGTGVLDLDRLARSKTSDRTSLKLRPAIHFSPVAGASTYDVVRGDVVNLKRAAGTAQLGHLVCLQNDGASTDVSDSVVPGVGKALFYLFRDNGADYETSSDGSPRVATGGDCPQ